ncbi:MAG: MerR family transcriptional regulator [Acidobacteria bacterium]|nr:MerR family transcriptional regulator [Acidobacteriota bacterium]
MALEPVVIPEKIYFKIGEVCELVGVQAHVLRYWETEFPMLSPQKNKSGQRSYRRRDVEIALRIKQLLYNEMFTIAGARKKLQSESRDGGRSKVTEVEAVEASDPRHARTAHISAPRLFDDQPSAPVEEGRGGALSGQQRDALKLLAAHLLELRELLKPKPQ